MQSHEQSKKNIFEFIHENGAIFQFKFDTIDKHTFRSYFEPKDSSMAKDNHYHLMILCGSDTFLDWNSTWNSDFPELSDCFRKIVLLWIPCLVFWVLFPFQIESIRKQSTVNWFHVSKLSLVHVFEMGHSWPLFSFLFVFSTVNST